jgi:hypothetical protein
MPSYAALLRPEHVADITAYLLEQKALDSASTKKKDLPEPPRTP